MFLNKYPLTTEKFYKDIIAGHFPASSLAGSSELKGGIYFDDESHYYIAGTVKLDKKMPILVFDEECDKYYALGESSLGKTRGERYSIRGDLIPLK